MPATIHAIRDLCQLLAERFPDARPLVERGGAGLAGAVATGISGLDSALPGEGFPRGKLSAWTPEGGSAAVLRAVARSAAVAGERTAWVDASHTLTLGWTGTGGTSTAQSGSSQSAPGSSGAAWRGWSEETPIVIRPVDRSSALRCAEVLLRCGAFGFLVLEGAEPQGTEAVRLTRAARDGGTAFVAITELASMATLRISSRLNVRGVRWRRGPFGDPAAPIDVHVDVRVRALGWNHRATLILPIATYDLRCAVGPGPDRRNGGADDTTGDRRNARVSGTREVAASRDEPRDGRGTDGSGGDG